MYSNLSLRFLKNIVNNNINLNEYIIYFFQEIIENVKSYKKI